MDKERIKTHAGSAPLPTNLGGVSAAGTKYIFETRMEVRDYECDIEGIVNNANYLHYTEHTRHLFLKQCGLSFAEMHDKGVDAVVARMNLQYKSPLRCDDEFISRLWVEKHNIKYIFHQDIYRASDSAHCFHGDITLVCLVNGKLGESAEYNEAFRPYMVVKDPAHL